MRTQHAVVMLVVGSLVALVPVACSGIDTSQGTPGSHPFTNFRFGDSIRPFLTGVCAGPVGSCPPKDGGTGDFNPGENRIGCNDPKANGGCRFGPVVWSINDRTNEFVYSLRVTTVPGDLYVGEARNELLSPLEYGDGAALDRLYRSGMDRYYRLIANFAELAPPPSYDDAVDAGYGLSAYQTFMQFRDEGACYSHVPLSLGFIRSFGPTGVDETGNEYRLALSVDPNYGPVPSSGPSTRQWVSRGGVPTDDQDIVLHVFWSTRACTAPCDWEAPDGGAVELWINDQRVLAKEMATLSTWPTAPSGECEARGRDCCAEQAKYAEIGNTDMPVSLRVGLAMDHMDGVTSRITFRRMAIGKACKDVFADCPRLE